MADKTPTTGPESRFVMQEGDLVLISKGTGKRLMFEDDPEYVAEEEVEMPEAPAKEVIHITATEDE